MFERIVCEIPKSNPLFDFERPRGYFHPKRLTCPSPPARNSVLTKSSTPSEPVAWAKSIGHATPSSGETSRSRYFLKIWPRMLIVCGASNRRPAPPRRSITPTLLLFTI